MKRSVFACAAAFLVSASAMAQQALPPIEIGAVWLKSVISGRGFEVLFRKAYRL